MNRVHCLLSLALVFGMSACQSPGGTGGTGETGGNERAANSPTVVVHDVYFSLTDDSEAAVSSLVRGCHEYLAELPGVAHFAAGTRDAGRTGGANDAEFDVSLHVWFENAEAYTSYESDPRHLAFIDAFRGNWESVRVFDSTATSRD